MDSWVHGVLLYSQFLLSVHFGATAVVRGQLKRFIYAVKAQTSLAQLSRFRGSCVTTAHALQCCIFQSYAKTVPSWMKLTMKLTMREPTFMPRDPWQRTCDHGVWRLTLTACCNESGCCVPVHNNQCYKWNCTTPVGLLYTSLWKRKMQRIVLSHTYCRKCTIAQKWCHNKFALHSMWICVLTLFCEWHIVCYVLTHTGYIYM